MRVEMAAVALLSLVACSAAQSASESFNALLKDGHVWCAYKDVVAFNADATSLKPTESARITYQASKLAELTYQVEAESGDWIVIDKYTSSNDDIILRRANLLVQDNRRIIQEATIHNGKAGVFHLVSVATLDGKKAKLSNADFPVVSVKTDLLHQPFVQAISEMRSRNLEKLCK